MATGNEMALKAAMNMVFKMFGIDTAQTQSDIVRACHAVLTFDIRLADIERNQLMIMSHLGIAAIERNENGHGHGHERSGETEQ